MQEPLGYKIFLVFLSTILEMTIRRRMDEYLLGDRYTLQDLSVRGMMSLQARG